MLKKSIAVLTAVAAIASASSVFAADYADQVVKLTDSEKAETLTDTTAQYTVVIVDKKTGNEAVTLSADDLYYINQGTSADSFWANMGTKTALTAGKTYTIRIGSNAEDFEVQEYDFTVKAAGNNSLTFVWGDITTDNTVDMLDAGAAAAYFLGTANSYTNAKDQTFTVGQTYGSHVWGDITADGTVDMLDAGAAAAYFLGTANNYTDTAENTFTVGAETTINLGK